MLPISKQPVTRLWNTFLVFSKSLKKVPKNDVVKDFTKRNSNLRIYLADVIIT